MDKVTHFNAMNRRMLSYLLLLASHIMCDASKLWTTGSTDKEKKKLTQKQGQSEKSWTTKRNNLDNHSPRRLINCNVDDRVILLPCYNYFFTLIVLFDRLNTPAHLVGILGVLN